MDTNERTRFVGSIRRCAKRLRREGIAALADLYDLTARRVVRYALILTRNPDDAEDAFQAAMVKIAVNPRALAGAKHPWAYFLKIVRNEALTIIRRRNPMRPAGSIVETWADDAAAMEELERRRHIRTALEKLPPTQSEVVILKIWEGMTFCEIGEVLGQSPNTAASRYRYALGKLMRHLEPYANEVNRDRE